MFLIFPVGFPLELGVPATVYEIPVDVPNHLWVKEYAVSSKVARTSRCQGRPQGRQNPPLGVPFYPDESDRRLNGARATQPDGCIAGTIR